MPTYKNAEDNRACVRRAKKKLYARKPHYRRDEERKRRRIRGIVPLWETRQIRDRVADILREALQ